MRNPSTFLHRHLRAACATGVVIVAMAGGGVAYAASGSSPTTSQTTPGTTAVPATPATPATPAAGAAGAKAHSHGARSARQRARHHLRGTITAISNGTWTLKTARGRTISVEVTSKTKFGTKALPTTAASYPVGTTVAVIVVRHHGTVSALQIRTPRVKPAAPAPAPAPAATPAPAAAPTAA